MNSGDTITDEQVQALLARITAGEIQQIALTDLIVLRRHLRTAGGEQPVIDQITAEYNRRLH